METLEKQLEEEKQKVQMAASQRGAATGEEEEEEEEEEEHLPLKVLLTAANCSPEELSEGLLSLQGLSLEFKGKFL